MSFRRVAEPKISTITIAEEECTSAPSTPTNFQAEQVSDDGDFRLTWNPPSEKVYFYEVFVNGSLDQTVRGTEAIVPDTTGGESYDFKVRGVGKIDCKGVFTNILTRTSSGLPDLYPQAYGEYKGGSVDWQNIVGVPSGHTIDGYNVYIAVGSHTTTPADFTKLNSSLISTSIHSYAYLGLSSDQRFTFAVTYEYDGGTESSMFFSMGTADSTLPKYYFKLLGYFELIGNNQPLLYRGGWQNIGLHLKDGAKVDIRGLRPPEPNQREWVGFTGSNDTWEMAYTTSLKETKKYLYEIQEGCASSNVKLKQTGHLHATNALADGGIRLGMFLNKGGFTIMGPLCEDRDVGVKFYVNVASEDVISFDSTDWEDLKAGRVSDMADQRLEVDIDSGNATFRTRKYLGLPYHNLYIEPIGDSYGTPHESNIRMGPEGYEVTGLSSGDYKAKVGYVLEDGSTELSTQTNEVTFTIP